MIISKQWELFGGLVCLPTRYIKKKPAGVTGQACSSGSKADAEFPRDQPSDVVGSMMVLTSLTLLAGKPPFVACSRTASSLGAMYTQ